MKLVQNCLFSYGRPVCSLLLQKLQIAKSGNVSGVKHPNGNHTLQVDLPQHIKNPFVERRGETSVELLFIQL